MFKYGFEHDNTMLLYYLAYGGLEYAKLRLSGMQRTIGCSLAPTSECNLKCKHCYEMNNRNSGKKDVSLEEFDGLAEKLAGHGMKHCTLTDGEPLISRQSIEKCESAIGHFWMTYIVTNGTREFPDFPVFYVMSLDGPPKVHDSIRGGGVFEQVNENIKKAPLDKIWGLCTLNTINHEHIEETVETARGLGLRGLMFNWHTPSSLDDPLWPDERTRGRNIDQIIELKANDDGFIYNESHVLEVMRTSDWTGDCPSDLVPSYDASGELKEPCIFGQGVICERCGCHVYPALKAAIMERKATGQFRMAMDFADMYWVRDGKLFDRAYQYVGKRN